MENSLFEKKLTINNLKAGVRDIFKEIERIKEKYGKLYHRFETRVEEGTLKCYGIKKVKKFREGLGGNLKYYRVSVIEKARTERIK